MITFLTELHVVQFGLKQIKLLQSKAVFYFCVLTCIVHVCVITFRCIRNDTSWNSILNFKFARVYQNYGLMQFELFEKHTSKINSKLSTGHPYDL